MKYKLTIQEKLKDLRVENGLSLEQLADATGISKSALSAYEVDENREINGYNLRILAKFYNVTSDYLLGLTETRRLSPLSTDSLRISDDAVKVLQDGKYNPLLLSEILTNDNFLRLMVDAEIYVDGNVTTQFHTLDKMVDAQRMIFVKKLHPEDYNLQAETLKRISITEDAFFEHTLSEDIVHIMREIRRTHLGDVESRADTSIVDRMAAISHDIRTPLAGAMGYLQLLDGEPERQEEYLKIVKKRLEELEELLESLFLYTRLQSGSLPLECGQTAALLPLWDALAEFYPQLEAAGIQPELHFDREDMQVWANPDALGRVYRNLIGNAIRHGDGGLTVTVRDGEIVFSNPLGAVPAPDPVHLFERFYQGNPARGKGGAGLGLSIVRELMEQMGGQVGAQVAENELHIKLLFSR